MKKVLLTTVVLTVVAVMCVISVKAQQQAQSAPKLKEVIAEQRRAELTSKYGLNDTQIESFEALIAERDGKYRQINNTQITPDERRAQRTAVTNEFREKVRTVMSPEQYDRWLSGQIQQAETLKRLHYERDARLKQIEVSDIPEEQKVEERKAMEIDYQTAVKQVVGEARVASVIDQQRGKREWYKNKNKGLLLTRAEAFKLAQNGKKRDAKIAEIESGNLSGQEERTVRQSIKENYKTQVKQTLGNQKYTIWMRNNAGNLDRSLTKRYNMTPEQIRQYKSLSSTRQLAKMKLRESTMAPEEKMIKNREIDQQFIDGLEKFLSPQQCSKVIRDASYHRQKMAQKRQRTRSVTAPAQQ